LNTRLYAAASVHGNIVSLNARRRNCCRGSKKFELRCGRRRAAMRESVAVLPQLELLLRRKIFFASIRKVGAYLRDRSVTTTLAAGL
jgi:hypothetical protein